MELLNSSHSLAVNVSDATHSMRGALDEQKQQQAACCLCCCALESAEQVSSHLHGGLHAAAARGQNEMQLSVIRLEQTSAVAKSNV